MRTRMTETRNDRSVSGLRLKVAAIPPALSQAAPRALAVLGFALLTWAGAKVSVPLPWTPVPATLQTLAVLLAGVSLGARAGAASQLAYLALGMLGAPVFALPGAGPLYLLSPTVGYLAGFVAGAYVGGRLHEATRRWGATGSILSLLAATAVIHACGVSWLALHLGGDLAAAARAGLWPFLPFELAKVVVAAGLTELSHRAVER